MDIYDEKIKKLEKKIEHLEQMLKDKSLELHQKQEELNEQQAHITFNAKLASVGEMASSLAHEINNPICIIEGQLRRLKYHTENKNYDEQINLIDRIGVSTKRVISIINGLRNLARPSENQKNSQIDLKHFLKEFEDLNYIKIIDSSFPVIYETINRSVLVEGKTIALSQVLTNLVNNAIDAIECHEKPWIIVRLEKDENFTSIRIIDSGKGIAEENLKKIYSPFYTTKSDDKGSGVGLYISKKLCEEMNALLTYEKLGENTSFVIKLKSVA